MGIQRSEGHFKGFDQADLFYQKWQSKDSAGLPTILITHGLGEHSESYNLFANGMIPKGYNIVAWDLRGHGRSEGKRGYVATFSDYSKDLLAFTNHLKGAGLQNFVYLGHSMGGLVTLRHVIENGPSSAQAMVLSSPALGVVIEVPKIKDLAARILNDVWPKLTLANEINESLLTHDETVIASYRTDSYRHDRISSGLYLSMLESFNFVADNAGKVELPVIMQLAGDDRVVSRKASEQIFAHFGSREKKLLVYEEMFHEIYNELEREKVYSDLDKSLKVLGGMSPKKIEASEKR